MERAASGFAGEDRVERVVQARHRRAQARAHHRAQRAHAVLDGRKPDAAQPLFARPRPDAQARAGDDGERPFAADDELRQVWSRARPVERAEDGAGAVDGLDREHHVLDLSVAAGELSRAAGREPAAGG